MVQRYGQGVGSVQSVETDALPPTRDADSSAEPSGLARVATVSFLAARAAPSGGFWISLAGGVALARGAQRNGARRGFGASLAAMLETVAIMGPARFGVPLTQAMSAPWIGRLEARGASAGTEVVACALVRIIHNLATTAFFIWVILGGLDAYAGTYDALPFFPGGVTAALVLTGVTLLAWTVFASIVQVLVYRRGLRTWPEGSGQAAEGVERRDPSPEPGRFDPRLVSLVALVGFVVLLSSTAWAVLAAVAGLLLVGWFAARSDPEVLPTGAVLAAALALSAFSFSMFGGLGLDEALRRATRAALLVMVATWLRAAAGSPGLRDVSRRVLHRLRRVPSVPEAASALDDLGAGPSLLPAGRSLVDALGGVPKRPLPFVDAVLGWVAAEAGREQRAHGEQRTVDGDQRTVDGNEPSTLSAVHRPPSTAARRT